MRSSARQAQQGLAGWAVAGLLLGGCVGLGDDSPGENESVGNETHAVVAGANTVTDTDVNPRWPEVVSVGGCSGTLISPVHVLTAGHCNIRVGATVQLDTPRSGGSGSGRRSYRVVKTNPLSRAVASGSDLDLLLLDQAVPTFGTAGSPEYSVEPAFAFATVSNRFPTWTVGYGNSRDCAPKSGSGTRRGLMFSGGFSRYPSAPGVVTRANLPCNDVNKGPSTGDSGGPLLDIFHRVVGVFSGWTCRRPSGARGGAGCVGTIEWTGLSPANAAWLANAKLGDFDGDGIADLDDPRPNLDCRGSRSTACNALRADFELVSIVAAGCTGTGGDPMVAVTVRNNGPVARRAWVDVFTDLPAAPTVGTLSSTFRRTRTLEMRETQTLSFAVTPARNRSWIDAIVDSPDRVDELDESNNVRSARISVPDCSFN